MSERKTISEYPVKPRRTRGTYTHKHRNRVASAVLAACSLVGLAYFFLPSTGKIRKLLQEEFNHQSEEYKQKKTRLAPFALDKNLEESNLPPVIVDPATTAGVRLGMAVNDKLNIQPDQ